MLEAASTSVFSSAESAGVPNEPVDARARRHLKAIELLAGATTQDVRGIALSILGDRDEALDRIVKVEPPAMTHMGFNELLSTILGRLERLWAASVVKRAV